MKAKQRLDKIIAICGDKMQDEASALLGKDLVFGDPEISVLTKQEFFAEPGPNSVFAHVQLEGDITGLGGILLPVKDAIRIGGTLIMLPDSELQTVITDENYTEELQDSYGEVANIFCGSLTSAFEEQHPQSFRIVRTEQEVVSPDKIDLESDQLIPIGSYYVCSFSIDMDENEMGPLQLLFPAEPLGLVEGVSSQKQQQANGASSPEESASQESGVSTVEEDASLVGKETEEAGIPDNVQQAVTSSPKKKKVNTEKQKKVIDTLLALCKDKLAEEVGALIGGTLKYSKPSEELYTKEELLEQTTGKQVMAKMDIRGDHDGEAYLMVDISTGIYLGGSLIMLPESELDETVRNEEFGEDANDAYGEIANIIAGVYTAVFEEQYRKKLGFVKTDLETIVPMKIDPESDEAIPNQLYYTSGCDVAYNDKELGRLQMVVPASVFDLEGLAGGEEAEEVEVPKPSGGQAGGGEQDQALGMKQSHEQSPESKGVQSISGGAANNDVLADVLVFSDDEQEGGSISATLTKLGFQPKLLHFKNQVGDHLTGAVRLVYIVMNNVSEQGFAVAIKVKSSGTNVPIIVAGPEWTRTLVIKAVKYGADDILMTPSTEADVQEKVDMNLSKIAA